MVNIKNNITETKVVSPVPHSLPSAPESKKARLKQEHSARDYHVGLAVVSFTYSYSHKQYMPTKTQ